MAPKLRIHEPLTTVETSSSMRGGVGPRGLRGRGRGSRGGRDARGRGGRGESTTSSPRNAVHEGALGHDFFVKLHTQPHRWLLLPSSFAEVMADSRPP